MSTHTAKSSVSLSSTSNASERIELAAGSLVAPGSPLVLAVSGGVDSMVLLNAVGAALGSGPRDHVVVGTFDHGTGSQAERAVEQVRRSADRWGVRCVAGRTQVPLFGEMAWRDARWRFLRGVAADMRGDVATAHTRDDQVETVVMRILRGSGARGMSGMRAQSLVRRPLIAIDRADIVRYAVEMGVTWTDDPSNVDRRYLRNRVRLELLPALRRVRPAIDGELLAIAEQAAALRRACTDVVRPLVRTASHGGVVASRVADPTWGSDARALLCQTVAEFGGITLDRRGTDRLSRFIVEGRPGSRIPLAGGFEAVLRHDTIELRRTAVVPAPVLLRPPWDARFGGWHFRRRAAPLCEERAGPSTEVAEPALHQLPPAHDPWMAWLPVDATTEVRPWRAGDRMPSSGSGLRRVKRFLSDSRVAAADRAGWPVVVSDGEIVWIPGVRRAAAASARSGRPRVCIVCERIQG
ncbi:MAG: tRNA lysidine(34) synthetase TilS [Gemmatimonadaceae bacterium]|nr:tRNA lysidine(34) synthetase TilS [Gemmatimonadaceae bacterium]